MKIIKILSDKFANSGSFFNSLLVMFIVMGLTILVKYFYIMDGLWWDKFFIGFIVSFFYSILKKKKQKNKKDNTIETNDTKREYSREIVKFIINFIRNVAIVGLIWSCIGIYFHNLSTIYCDTTDGDNNSNSEGSNKEKVTDNENGKGKGKSAENSYKI